MMAKKVCLPHVEKKYLGVGDKTITTYVINLSEN